MTFRIKIILQHHGIAKLMFYNVYRYGKCNLMRKLLWLNLDEF